MTYCPWSIPAILQVFGESPEKNHLAKDSYKNLDCLEHGSHVSEILWKIHFKLRSSIEDYVPIKTKTPFVETMILPQEACPNR